MMHGERMATLSRDSFAGMTVFLVALPLCLGIAQASGVNAVAGLLAGVIGGLIVAPLSGSRLSVSGPAAGLIAIVTQGIAEVGGFPAFLSALCLAGAVQFGFGALKMGRFAAYIPSAVIKGMLAAIGLLLVIKQTPVALGWQSVEAGFAGGARLATPFGSASIAPMAVAVLSFAMLAVWETQWVRQRALLRAIPAPLAVVIAGIVATLSLQAYAPQFALPAAQRVSLASIDSLGALAGVLNWPDLAQFASIDVWRLGLTLAIVASIETLLSVEAIEQMDPKKELASADRELRAQGVGNMLAGMLGALPLTAVIVRSTANLHAGAQTRASAFIHGVLLLVSVFLLAPVLNLIPLASLAAILIATGLKLAKPSLLRDAAHGGIDRLVPFVVTVVGVVSVDLLAGVAMGLACCAIFALRATLKQALSYEREGDAFVVRFSRHVPSFAKGELKEKLGQLPDRTTVIIDDSHAEALDADVQECIMEFVRRSAHRGIVVRWSKAEEERHPAAARPLRHGWHPPSAGEALARNHRLAR